MKPTFLIILLFGLLLAPSRACVAAPLRSDLPIDVELKPDGTLMGEVASVDGLPRAAQRVSVFRGSYLVAEAALADHVIRAPFGGRLGLREVSVGSLVQPGTVITTLDDLTPVELEFTVLGTYPMGCDFLNR